MVHIIDMRDPRSSMAGKRRISELKEHDVLEAVFINSMEKLQGRIQILRKMLVDAACEFLDLA